MFVRYSAFAENVMILGLTVFSMQQWHIKNFTLLTVMCNNLLKSYLIFKSILARLVPVIAGPQWAEPISMGGKTGQHVFQYQ